MHAGFEGPGMLFCTFDNEDAEPVQPWGGYFGKLTDRFGVQWMFNCAA